MERSLAEIEQLVCDFTNGTLPRSLWTHEAHLSVGIWHLWHKRETAIAIVCQGIQRFNLAQGIDTTPESGYHETLTIFWMRCLQNELANLPENISLEEAIASLLPKLSDSSLPLQYYSLERLISTEARLGWVEPDIQQLS